MRFVYTLIFVVFAGFNAFAQTAEQSTDLTVDSMFDSLTNTDSKAPDVSIDAIVNSVTDQLMGTSETTEPVRSATEGKLVVEEVLPEVNRTAVEAVDVQTGRYPPRLKIDFTEFPLRNLTYRNQTGDSIALETSSDIAQRIKSRLMLPKIRVTVNGRIAAVSGTVATDRQRFIVESMLRFEPGIDSIRNDLVVSP